MADKTGFSSLSLRTERLFRGNGNTPPPPLRGGHETPSKTRSEFTTALLGSPDTF